MQWRGPKLCIRWYYEVDNDPNTDSKMVGRLAHNCTCILSDLNVTLKSNCHVFLHTHYIFVKDIFLYFNVIMSKLMTN